MQNNNTIKNEFTVLFDYDSMIYKSVYRIVTISDIRGWIRENKTREWMENEIINLAINRLSNMANGLLSEVEETGINIEMVEYFLTDCKNSIRKKSNPTYKANRIKRKNKWVGIIRKELLKMESFVVHDQYEADDLIKDRAVELGVDNFVIITMDKDFEQIPGIQFDYYTEKRKNENGEYILDQYGEPAKFYRGLKVITEKHAQLFLATQLLTGDSGDNVKGIKGIGPTKAKKILLDVDPSDYKNKILKEYIKHFGKEGQKQFDLHLLLLGLGVKYRDFLN